MLRVPADNLSVGETITVRQQPNGHLSVDNTGIWVGGRQRPTVMNAAVRWIEVTGS